MSKFVVVKPDQTGLYMSLYSPPPGDPAHHQTVQMWICLHGNSNTCYQAMNRNRTNNARHVADI